MHTPGTPLNANDFLRFGALLLDVASRVIRDQEVLKYWLRHTGDFESLTREFAIKPGCRVLQVDRTTHAVVYDKKEIAAQDPASAAIEDIDLSQIRYIRYSKFDVRKHTHLDAYVLATLVRRREVLPRYLLENPTGHSEVSFLGTEFKELEDKKEYVWVCSWYPTHKHTTMAIARSRGELTNDMMARSDQFIAVLLKY